ncbi:MAG: FMN-binding protein [Candidatus Paceibacterota bacterium]|jgi:uncharacterized protein with FMN-binding domain
MKKFFVSTFFILAFFLNALYQRSIYSNKVSSLATIEQAARGTEDVLTRNYFENINIEEATTPVSQQVKTISSPATSVVVKAKAPTPTNTSPTPITSKGKYRDGIYTGNEADAGYGIIQVKATITNGKISGIKFLSYPNDRPHSVEVSNYSMPILRQEAIAAQSENVDVVSGASYTSAAFVESLGSALAQAL